MPTGYAPSSHHRRSIRLKRFDYSTSAAYFVTICAERRIHRFGEVKDGVMRLNAVGEMIGKWIRKIGEKYDRADTDIWVVMPNHVHLLIGTATRIRPYDPTRGAHMGAPLPRIIQWFKTMTTNAYLRGIAEEGFSAFTNRLWQRNYYEHIVRDEFDLRRIEDYIRHNPLRWHLDRENLDRTGEDEFDAWLDAIHDRPAPTDQGDQA